MVCSVPVSWQEAKTLAKETLVVQSSTEAISLVQLHGVTDAQLETDPEYMPMSHITAAGSILNNEMNIIHNICFM